MTSEVRLRPEAEQDVEDAANWYEQQRDGLGHEFLDELSHTLTFLAEHPHLHPVIHRGVRRALMRRFPFGVFYLSKGSVVLVVAVMHGRRDPRRWKDRR